VGAMVTRLAGGGAAADFLKKQVYCRMWRFAWLDQDEMRYLRHLERLIALGRDGARERSLQKLQPFVDDLVLKAQNRGLYNRLRYPSVMSVNSLSRVFTRSMRAQTERSLVITRDCGEALWASSRRFPGNAKGACAGIPSFCAGGLHGWPATQISPTAGRRLCAVFGG